MSTTSTETLPVQSVMQREVLRVSSDDNIQVALETMVDNHVSALPVVDDGQLIGIVSLSDLLPIGEEGWSDPVSTATTAAPVTVQPEEPILEAGRLMLINQVHHLPVVGKDRRLVGIVSSIDFVRLVVDGVVKTT